MYLCCAVKLQPAEPAAEILVAALAELGFESFEETPGGLNAYIQKESLDLEALAALPYWSHPDWTASWTLTEIPDQNWNAVWEADYAPIRVGESCVVRAAFHPVPGPEVRYDLVITPKMSFGTGHHQTTWLMLSALLEFDLQGKSVLDMGAGTGVLAILAAKKGAQPVLAVDNDPGAVASCRENADANGQSRIRCETGDAELLAGKHFDLILANINRNILLEQLPAYVAALNPGGSLLMSGFYGKDLEAIRDASAALGLIFESSREKDHWTLARFNKPDY